MRTYPTKPLPFPEYEGTSASSVFPFEVVPTKGGTVRLNWYSYLMKDFDIRKPVPVFGLYTPFTLTYPNKIYLETYFNAQQVPVVSQVRADDRWVTTTTTKKTLDGASEKIHTYPNAIELISEADIPAKSLEIRNDIDESKRRASEARAAIQDQLAAKTISQADADQVLSQLDYIVPAYVSKMEALEQSFNVSFKTANKKQLKCYTLIAYTTTDAHPDLGGKSFANPPESKPSSFQLIQCVNSDLMLVDTCYRNVPCKVAIPWHRPVYQYRLSGGIEDEINTKIKDV